MPGHRPGVFRRRHHYRPKRRVAIRAVAAVVAEECRLTSVGIERAPLVSVANVTVETATGRAPLVSVGVWCREDI